jgi:hypothetical protein
VRRAVRSGLMHVLNTLKDRFLAALYSARGVPAAEAAALAAATRVAQIFLTGAPHRAAPRRAGRATTRASAGATLWRSGGAHGGTERAAADQPAEPRMAELKTRQQAPRPPVAPASRVPQDSPRPAAQSCSSPVSSRSAARRPVGGWG